MEGSRLPCFRNRGSLCYVSASGVRVHNGLASTGICLVFVILFCKKSSKDRFIKTKWPRWISVLDLWPLSVLSFLQGWIFCRPPTVLLNTVHVGRIPNEVFHSNSSEIKQGAFSTAYTYNEVPLIRKEDLYLLSSSWKSEGSKYTLPNADIVRWQHGAQLPITETALTGRNIEMRLSWAPFLNVVRCPDLVESPGWPQKLSPGGLNNQIMFTTFPRTPVHDSFPRTPTSATKEVFSRGTPNKDTFARSPAKDSFSARYSPAKDAFSRTPTKDTFHEAYHPRSPASPKLKRDHRVARIYTPSSPTLPARPQTAHVQPDRPAPVLSLPGLPPQELPRSVLPPPKKKFGESLIKHGRSWVLLESFVLRELTELRT